MLRWELVRLVGRSWDSLLSSVETHLSREKVRRRFEERFTVRRMAQDYLSVYRSLMTVAEPHLRLVVDEAPAAPAK